ncbi:hypothetical protein KAR91_79950 [Candidatus Pacearchaeota archaeon]|nr:hypothetical protein [Candidatus Pacearchaeota archaeon]
MSDPKPDPKDTPTPPTTTDKPKPRDFKIMIEDSKLPDDLKVLMAQQHDENVEMRKTIQEMNTREQLGLRDQAIEVLLKELGDIRPDLVEEYKDEKDLGILKNAIKVAKKLTSKYRDIALDDEGKEIVPPKAFTSIDPITRKPRIDT